MVCAFSGACKERKNTGRTINRINGEVMRIE
jgi:hypothetical protein